MGVLPRLLGFCPLSKSSGLLTTELITETAATGPQGGNAPTLDALAALLSLDQPTAVSPQTSPIRNALVDLNGDGNFDVNDVQAFINYYFANPANPGSTLPTPNLISVAGPSGPAPDFTKFDLNGDGFSGVFSRTPLDLDPTGSTQRGAPVLTTLSVTLPSPPAGTGQVISIDETQVSDLDVMCFYAYSPLFNANNTGADSNNAVRSQLGCGVQVMAQTGDTPTGFAQTISNFDTKVAINKSGQVAFSGSATAGQNAGFVMQTAGTYQAITTGGSTSRQYSGASLTDTSPNTDLPTAAFVDRISGSPPTYYDRTWAASGPVSNSTIGVSAKTQGQGFCQGGVNVTVPCNTSLSCPIDNSSGVQIGYAACSALINGGYVSSESYIDLSDNGLIVFPVFRLQFLRSGSGGTQHHRLEAAHELHDAGEHPELQATGIQS